MFIFNEKILNQIKGLSDNKIQDYILARTTWLEERIKENREVIEPDSMRKSTVAHGFISKETEMYAEAGGGSIAIGGFIVDDTEIYKILINHLKKQETISSLNDVLQAIQSSIDEYFGGLASENNEVNRRNLYLEIEKKYDEFEPYSISEFRNNDTALCAERAAIAQNMLAFLGADTYYMMGHLSRNDGMSNMNHAYNIIVDKEYGSGIIVDFTNPVLRKSIDERYVYQSKIINKTLIQDYLVGKYQEEITRPEFFTKDDNEYRKTLYCMYSLDELSEQDLKKLHSKKSIIEEVEKTEKGARGQAQEQTIGKSQAQAEREQKDKEAENRTQMQSKNKMLAQTYQNTQTRQGELNSSFETVQQTKREQEQQNENNLDSKRAMFSLSPEQRRLNEQHQRYTNQMQVEQSQNNTKKRKRQGQGMGR